MPRSHHARPRRRNVDGWPTTGRPAPSWASDVDQIVYCIPSQSGLHYTACNACQAPIHMADTLWRIYLPPDRIFRLCWHCGSCLALHLGFRTPSEILAIPTVCYGRFPPNPTLPHSTPPHAENTRKARSRPKRPGTPAT